MRGTAVSFAAFVIRFSKPNLTLVALRSLPDRGREGTRVGGVVRQQEREGAGEDRVGGEGGHGRCRRCGCGHGRERTGRSIIGQDEVAPPTGRAKRAQWPRCSSALRWFPRLRHLK